MLRAARQTKAGAALAQISAVGNVPAPTGGLNARDGLTGMGPTDAALLENWFPEAQYVVPRGGTALWSTPTALPVRTLLTWYGGTTLDKIFAGSGTAIYNVSVQGAASTPVVTGLTNPNFQWTNITTPGGNFLIVCNGADSVRLYDGTTWTTPAITGVASSTLINVFPFKQRLWFAQVGTLSAWYLPAASIAGAAVEFPLGSVFRKGGFIMALGSFSQDAGDGMDDYLSIITSNGEVAVYQGIDPNSSNTFGLVGIFNTGKPIGRRCMARVNGDLAIVTQDGVISMQALLQFSRESDQKATITGKIQTLFGNAAKAYSQNFGWQILIYPPARYCVVNYAVVADTQQRQFVMNTVTGAWTTFSNLNAGCWTSANDRLYYGGNAGSVFEANTGMSDAGGNINLDVQTAWRDFSNIEGFGNKKMFTAVKPLMLTGGGLSYQLGIDVDFASQAQTGAVAALPITGAVWPMVWPWVWGGNSLVDSRWRAAGGIGVWSSVRMRASVNGASCQLNAFNVLMQRGGPF